MKSKIKELLGKLRCQKNPSETFIYDLKKSYPTIPLDYLETMRLFNGGEGWINASYIRFYPLEDLNHINQIYHVQEFLPEMLIFASTGNGEAYAFDFGKPQLMIRRIPFIPLDIEYSEIISPDFESFICQLALEETENNVFYEINEDAFQKEVHEKQPIVFGGDPNDPDNVALVPIDAHAEISYFWNGVFQSNKRENDGGDARLQ